MTTTLTLTDEQLAGVEDSALEMGAVYVVALCREVRSHRARSAQPTPGTEEIERLVDGFREAVLKNYTPSYVAAARETLLSAVSRLAARSAQDTGAEQRPDRRAAILRLSEETNALATDWLMAGGGRVAWDALRTFANRLRGIADLPERAASPSPAPPAARRESPARSLLRTLREVIHADPHIIAAAEKACEEMEGAASPATERTATTGPIVREGKGVVEDPHGPSRGALLCLGCGKLPPHSGSETICPACYPPNGTCSCPGCALAQTYRDRLEVLAEEADKFAATHDMSQPGHVADLHSLAEFARAAPSPSRETRDAGGKED